ncbi:MAG TPA: dienelactone hydrolase family protein [Bacteroidota bacterium]|nr:dienelactone hydrolase family protein [Bacteroidota bacterium]
MTARRVSFFLFLFSLACSAGVTTTAAQGKFRSSVVRYASGKDTVSAWLCVPEGKGPFPGIMVIHEWWGLNAWVKEGAERLAKEGYIALAIDLYRGKVADSADDAHQLMRGVPEDRAARDLKAAFDHLRGRKDVIPAKIGSVGWCMGGGYSLQAAVAIPELSAAVICYGRLVTDSSAIAGIGASILGIFGARDKGIPEESVLEFEGTAKGMQKDVNVTIYPEAGHAFMNPGNAGGYREADAKDAWTRILAFFGSKFNNH